MLANQSETAISMESWAKNLKGNLKERKPKRFKSECSSHLEKSKHPVMAEIWMPSVAIDV